MRLPLRTTFRRVAGRASGALVLTVTLASGCGIPPGGLNSSCIRADQSTGFEGAEEKKLRRIFNNTSLTASGRHIMTAAVKDGTEICFQPHLNVLDKDNTITAGIFYSDWNRIGLNPGEDDVKLVSTLVHEGRHKQQAYRGIEDHRRGNIPEHERVILNWVSEADARVASILFAYEMAQQGNKDYMAILKRDNWYRHMIKAFEQSLQERPADIPAAMRAGFRAFRENQGLTDYYDNLVVNDIANHRRFFNARRSADSLLTKQRLLKIGAMGAHGNYMNDELILFIRGSVTAKDYQMLHKNRRPARAGFDFIPTNMPPL